jgi:secretion/DNA translocation related CpaE-like protein
LTVLSCSRDGEQPAPDAVGAVLESSRRSGDVVVCDLPRHLPDPAVAALDRAELVVLVVPAEVRACAAATPIADRLRSRGAPVRLVVRGPSPGGLAPSDVSRTLSLPLLTSMRPAPGLAAALETGRLPFRSARNPLARAAETVLDVLTGVTA